MSTTTIRKVFTCGAYMGQVRNKGGAYKGQVRNKGGAYMRQVRNKGAAFMVHRCR